MLLLAGAAFAANNVLNIKCVDASGNSLAGAKVEILALGTGGKWQSKTADKSGAVKFDKLNDGVYRVVARMEGFAPGLNEPIALRNDAQEAVTVQCSPGDPLKKFYFEDDAMNLKSRELLREAMGALQEQKFAEADKLFGESLEINPTSADTLFYQGVSLVQQSKWGESEATFQKALKIASALTALPQPKNTQDPKAPPPPNQYVDMAKNINAMLAMLPGLKLLVEGNAELNKKNYKQAIAKFEEAAKIRAGDPETHYSLALALGHDLQYDAAIAAIDRAIALKTDDKVYADLKQRLIHNAALSKVKDVADQGDNMYNTKDYAGALKKYEEALSMVTDPGLQAGIHAQIGQTYDMLKQPEQAEQSLLKAIELAPQETKFKDQLSRHYDLVAQRFLDAKDYEQAFAAYAKGGKSLLNIAKTWASKPENEELAILAFERVIKTDPQNAADAWFQLGTVYYFGQTKKDNVKAKEALTKYLELGKDEKILENARNIIAVIDRKK